MQKLSSHFGRNRGVRMRSQQSEESLLLLRRNVLFVSRRHEFFGAIHKTKTVPLHKCEQALVPEHGQSSLVTLESQEVEDQGIHDAEGQRILLVQQDTQENTVGSYGDEQCLGWRCWLVQEMQ